MADFPATRWSLIARLGDQPAQAPALLGLYADAIGGYLAGKLRGEGAERAADIVQEVLLDLLRQPEVLARAAPGGGSRFRHYLMHVAWRSACNRLRWHRRREHASLDADDAGPAAAPPADQAAAMDRAWALSVVQQAMDELAQGAAAEDADEHRIVRAHLAEGRSLREIAAATGIPLATCSRRLARGRQRVQRAIAERLRLAGELGPDEDDLAAGERLLESLRG